MTNAERLAKFLTPEPNTGCLLFSGRLDSGGYGRFRLNGKMWSAHRAAWTLVFEAIPDGAYVLHKCDTPACCNPAHLRLGTHQDNMRDMSERRRGGRSRYRGAMTDAERAEIIRLHVLPAREIARRVGRSVQSVRRTLRTDPEIWATHKRLSPEAVANGSLQYPPQRYFSKIKAEDVPHIHAMFATGAALSQVALAFGISDRSVRGILAGETWRHLHPHKGLDA